MNYYIDKRFFVNGKKSRMFMDDPFNLTEYIVSLTGQTGIIGARNGLKIDTDLVNGNIFNYVVMGGPLLEHTEINGSGFDFKIELVDELFLSATTTSLEGIAILDLLGDNTSITGETLLNIRTPNVVNSIASDNQILTLTDSNTGESEFKDKKTVVSFVAADWVSGVKIDVTASTHNQGANPIVQVIGPGNEVMIPGNSLGLLNTTLESIKINTVGDVTITCDTPFDGKLIIQ